MEALLIILFYAFLCTLVAYIVGDGRRIGFKNTFFVCLLISPFIGLIVALLSEKKENVR